MKDELYYDPHAMKTAASKGAHILEKIRLEIDLLEQSEEIHTGRHTDRRNLESLREICGGYEKLLLYMNGAANVYGAAEKYAAKSIDF